jgi:hypothetical protein
LQPGDVARLNLREKAMYSHSELRSPAKHTASPMTALLTRTLLGLGAAIVIASSASAQTVLNTALNGCYSYREHTTATSTPLLVGKGQEVVGTMCFNGSGIATDGHTVSTNGTVTSTAGTNSISGSYSIFNFPYWGMGNINFTNPAAIGYWATVNDIGIGAPPGVAHGYQFMRTAGDVAAEILGGTAFYQGPPAAYNDGVLTGCYSFLSETTLTASVATGVGKDLVGLICFNGSGGLTVGGIADVNGSFSFSTLLAGSYTITNAPGYGMGTMTFGTSCPAHCSYYEIAVHDVTGTNPLAGGFQFTLIKPSANGHTVMEGGNATYQQP